MPSYYRPISLTTSLYKIMAKALANRLKVTLADTVAENQKALIKGRQITDAILIANEAIDTWKQKKTKGFVLKLDIEKAHRAQKEKKKREKKPSFPHLNPTRHHRHSITAIDPQSTVRRLHPSFSSRPSARHRRSHPQPKLTLVVAVVRFRPIVAQSSAAVEPLRSSSDFVTQATPIVTPLRRISFNASHFAVAQSTAASSVVVHRRSPQPESHAHPTRIAAPTPFSTKSDLTHVSSLQPDSGLQSLRTANQPDSRPSP
ncbi:LINE-1 retrotransposable element ORF2 protein [Cucumis melo var. makuwa]|uniref:LINE-1 retrotransposable element ORF2 protein n=1 Tax=Cucumis melo var. makuwa TaxID=1194695 RepID=A0A5D3C9L9_CUCMM|nr:LINE-1 retrotransposable element ORF2 protein [Cucumis melo var. makuwa]